MHRLVIFAALVGAVAVALPDVSEESDDVDTYFRAASGSLVKVDSEEDEEVKAFRYNYPLTYSVKNEEDSSEDEEFRFVAPSVQTYSAPAVVVENVDSNEDEGSDESVSIAAPVAYSAVPSIQPVGFKPLFTGYKAGEWNTVSARSMGLPSPAVVVDLEKESSEEEIAPARLAYSAIPISFKQVFTSYKPTTKAVEPIADVVVDTVAPVAEEYKAPAAEKVDTHVVTKPVSINIPTAFSPLVYTAPTVAHVSAVPRTVAHVGAIPSTAAVTSFNSFYPANTALTYTNNALTYSAPTYSAPTYYASRPFFYAQKVNSFPYNYVVEKDN